MGRKRNQKKNKGGAEWTDRGIPQEESTASVVAKDPTLGTIIKKSKDGMNWVKDLAVGAVFNNPDKPTMGGRRKRQKGGGEKEDLIGKPVGKETCHMDIRKPQKGGNKNKYQGCGGDVFKGLYGGSKNKSKRNTKMRRSRSSRKKRGRGTIKTCPTGQSWDFVAKNCLPIDVVESASSGVGGKRRRRRRTKRRKSKRRRKSRKKSRRKSRRRSRRRRR